MASAPSGTTNFVINAQSGAVTTSGPGNFVPYTASRTALTTITINCAGGANCSHQATVTITAGSATGRAGALTGLTADFTGTTGSLANGQSSASGGTTLSFVMNGVGNNSSKNFHLGMTLPITSSGTVGAATAAYSVSVSASGVNTGSGGAAAQATVEGALTMSKASDLAFGRLARIANTSGTATWTATGQTWSLSGAVPVTGHTIGHFTVSGTANQQIQFIIPSTITMTNGTGNTLGVTVSTNGQGSQSIPAGGTFDLWVGGQISFGNSTPTGAYTGLFAVTTYYQ